MPYRLHDADAQQGPSRRCLSERAATARPGRHTAEAGRRSPSFVADHRPGRSSVRDEQVRRPYLLAREGDHEERREAGRVLRQTELPVEAHQRPDRAGPSWAKRATYWSGDRTSNASDGEPRRIGGMQRQGAPRMRHARGSYPVWDEL